MVPGRTVGRRHMSRRTFGSTRKLPSGQWQASYWYEGRRFVAPDTFRTKADAGAWLSSIESGIRAGSWIDPRGGEISFAEWCDWYFEGATHKRATTMARDRMVTRVHLLPALGTSALIDITPVHVRRLVAKMTESLAPTTVRTNYGVLRAILAAAVEADLLVRSPCRGIRMPPHERKEVRFLSPHEFERLADAMPLEYRPMVYVAGVLGLRWSEVAGLRVGRVDLAERRLAVLETLAEVEGRVSFADVKSPASRRVISMPGFITSMLAKHLLRRGRPRIERARLRRPRRRTAPCRELPQPSLASGGGEGRSRGPHIPRTATLCRRSLDRIGSARPRSPGAYGTFVESCHP